MMNVFFKSDFAIKDSSDNYNEHPFVLAFWTYRYNRKFVASFDGETYTNCKLNPDGSLKILFHAHDLGVGVLKCQKTFFITDEEGNTLQKSYVGSYDVRLTIKHGDIYTDTETNVCFCKETPNLCAGKVVENCDGSATMINDINGVQLEKDGSVTINI